ncbi:MAG TPA: hypothetical protein PLB88_08725 [Thermoanaerobaculaceae bacterium]|nr:hypothetical protein [Thermoanaerobaculaceae bacterium]HQU34386.1 hypothetical protein [Thermoanaerobaculaceae bacterium]
MQRSAYRDEAADRVTLALQATGRRQQGDHACQFAEQRPLPQPLAPQVVGERQAERDCRRPLQAEPRQRLVEVVALVPGAHDLKRRQAQRRGAAPAARQAHRRTGPGQQQLGAGAVTGRERHVEAVPQSPAGPRKTHPRRAGDRVHAEQACERRVRGRQQRRSLSPAVGGAQRGQRRQRVHEVAEPVGQVDEHAGREGAHGWSTEAHGGASWRPIPPST